ncbi:MAG: M23 family metallopeptidase [Acidimicrobiales bacterium]
MFDIDGDGILDEVTPEVDPGQTEDEVDGPPPVVTVTIPPPNRFDNAVEWTPAVALVSDIDTARQKFDDADERLTTLVATVRSFRLQQKRLAGERELLDEASLATLIALEAAQERLRLRALNAFVDGDEVGISDVEDFGQVPEDEAQQSVVDIVFEADRALIAAHEADSSALAVETRRVIDRTRMIARSLSLAEDSVADAQAELEQAAAELEAFEAGSGVYISGITFPIAWPYSVPLINSWGFPRSGGRRHEGIDIFAAAGTPLVATERGVVTRIGNGTLGGLRLWLRGESGTDWYYAHLSGFAPGLHENQVVEVGELIGYVGNTGNAVGTPPHLHMQIHPNGGDPVNPYPLLKLVSDDEIAARSLADAE